MSPETRQRAAKELLNSKFFLVTLQEIKADIFNEFMGTDPLSHEKRELLYHAKLGIEKVEAAIRNLAENPPSQE
jgi:hypothetical protein